jgi:hypothetical protein
LEEEHLRGVIPKSFDHIFDNISKAGSGKRFLVRVSFMEIYNEEIRDLLGDDSKKRLELKEDKEKGVYVKDLTVSSLAFYLCAAMCCCSLCCSLSYPCSLVFSVSGTHRERCRADSELNVPR